MVTPGTRWPVPASHCREPNEIPMPKLADTQLIVISSATQRDDGIIAYPPGSREGLANCGVGWAPLRSKLGRGV